MNPMSIAEAILNATDSQIYVADTESYEILYVNQTVCRTLNLSESQCIGKKCYKVLQGLEAPCPFCTNRYLSLTQDYAWEHYNASLDRYFLLRDRLLAYGGRYVRLEIGTDITKQEYKYRQMEDKLSVTQALLNCIDTLKNNQDMDRAIDGLLENICIFYQAERAYLFEIDWENRSFSNTHEWCARGVSSQIATLQRIPVSVLDRWLELFETRGYISIQCLEQEVDSRTLEYEILAVQGIESLIAAPLENSDGKKLQGFIGVDNPTVNFESAELLCAISNFVLDDLNKRFLMRRLEQLSYEDALTGVRNRNAYLKRLEELEKEPPKNLGILYLDVDNLKEANDRYGHAFGDALIVQTAKLLRKIYGESVFRVGGDEFVTLCPNIDKEDFEEQERRFRRQAAEEKLQVSLGAHWRADGREAAAQIKQADEMMYREKQEHHRMNSRVMYAGNENRREE